MIDRRYHRSLQLFSWAACTAMGVKLVLFTDYGASRRRGLEEAGREPQPHVFTELQRYADRKLDAFFGVDAIKRQAETAAKDQQQQQQQQQEQYPPSK